MLPDGKTVVGRDESDKKKLMIEDITSNSPAQIGEHKDDIRTLLFDEASKTLLVGDDSGHVLQYKQGESGEFSLLKDYGNVGVGCVRSSTQVGDFTVFGGTKQKIKVIDIQSQRLLEGSIETAYEDINSLRACRLTSEKVLLSVGGRNPSFSESKTDVFEI